MYQLFSDLPQSNASNYKKITQELFKLSLPFTGAHLALVGYTILNGIIINHLDENAMAAGALIGTTSYLIFSTIDGVLYATGILVSENEATEQNSKKIGAICCHSWLLSTLMAIPTTIILSQMDKILLLCGVKPDVSHAAQEYFSAINYGVLPIILNFSDQQLILGLHKPKLTFVSVSLSSIMSMIIGYPLTLGLWGLPKLGLKGIGYGAAVSGTISLFGLRLYMFLNTSFAQYNFYDKNNLKNFVTYFKKILKLGLPIGLQNFSAWLNLSTISFLLAHQSSSALISEQSSISMTSAYMIIMLAFAQANGTVIAKYYGQYNQLGDLQKDKLLKHTKSIGLNGLVTGGGIALTCAALFSCFSEQITKQYINEDNCSSDILAESKKMLITNALGLIPDTLRVILSGILRGYEDVIFAPVISFFCMSFLGLPISGLLLMKEKIDNNGLFIIRNIGICLATLVLFHRFLKHKPKEQIVESNSFICASDPLEENVSSTSNPSLKV
jgi:MATE family multidrug resistance protein